MCRLPTRSRVLIDLASAAGMSLAQDEDPTEVLTSHAQPVPKCLSVTRHNPTTSCTVRSTVCELIEILKATVALAAASRS
jgi:hypothetical protein